MTSRLTILETQVDERFYYHDDVWLSLYLHDVKGIPTCDIVDRINDASRGDGPASDRCTGMGNPNSSAVRGPTAPVRGGATTSVTEQPTTLGSQDKVQFLGSMHGRPGSAAWNTSLRRLGNNLTRFDLTQQLIRCLSVSRSNLLGPWIQHALYLHRSRVRCLRGDGVLSRDCRIARPKLVVAARAAGLLVVTL